MTLGPDLAAGARDLVGEVQRFGLFSAVAVVDRYVAIVDRAISRDGLAPAPAGDDEGPGRPADASAAVAAWVRLADATSTLIRGDATRVDAPPTLDLPDAGPGSRAQASFWIHNTTPSGAPAIDLHVSELGASSGHRIPAEALSLVPARVDLLAAGTSQEVRLAVAIPAGQPAGCYLGLVMTSAAPSEPLVVRLEVGP